MHSAKLQNILHCNSAHFKLSPNFRYDDLVDYNGRDIIIVLPGPTTMYDISSLAVMDSINQRMLGWVELPSSEALETHGLPPSLGQNSQWWPDLDERR